jgi:tagatose 6-phosphate kinase
MILCIGTTPATQRVMVFERLRLDAVNRAASTLDGAAGKSINVAKVLKALGEQPVAVTFLGGDGGERLRALLEQRSIELDFIQVAAPTRQCVTVIDRSTHTHTELVEESAPVAPEDFDRLRELIHHRLPSAKAMALSGTLAPGGPPDFYRDCVRAARRAGVLSIVDAQAGPLLHALSARPSLVKPNRAELAATVRRELDDAPSVMSAMRELRELGAQRVIVTDGARPTLAYDGQTFWRVISPSIAAVNPIGSGDAFTAGAVWRLTQSDDLGDACRWGAAAGVANALTTMAGEIRREDVNRLAREITVTPL